MWKRLFDLASSIGGLVLIAPVLAAVAIAIKIDSAGPVFYRADRVGRHGTLFRMYKFRTMVVGADKIGASSTPDDDPRITRVGRFLRRTSHLDELPQLINVMNGDMSLVGPRPQIKWAVDLLPPEEKEAILSVRPGMTDYASLRFPNEGEILRGSADPDRDYLEKIAPEKTKLQVTYVRERSLLGDIKILFSTFRAVL